MVDPITLSVSLGAVLVAIMTHVKFSKCWGFEIQTRSLKQTPPSTPIKNVNESSALLLSSSDPIPIPEISKIKK